MASGKQTSFQFGEVSPSLRFRSDAISYSSGLSKLKNMYVRRAGGVSNRPGLEFVGKSEFQQDIPDIGGDPGVKGFTVWDSETLTWKTYEYGKLYNTTNERYEYGFLVNSSEKIFTFEASEFFRYDIVDPAPKDILLTPTKSGLFVSPSATIRRQALYLEGEVSLEDTLEQNFVIQNDKLVGIAPFSSIFSLVTVVAVLYEWQTAPKIAGAYLVTGINLDDVEVFLARADGIFLPNASLRNDLIITSSFPPTDLKRINIYRAAAKSVATTPYFKLAGIIPIDSTSGNVFEFSDFGAEDASQTPPTDISFFPSGFSPLKGINYFCYYQQRAIAAPKPNITPAIKSGDILASKLGAPLQFSSPLIYTNTGAFQFSIPITDGSPVVAMLPMERLIAFTERGVYAIRGGEQGALTPTSVNPLLISEEGCSKTVQPKMAGTRGYFINNSHTKLMFIIFGDDGNLRVSEASAFSDHLLSENISQLEVLSGNEDTVYLLRKDGKLVQVTVFEDGSHGFSLVETNGYIESIFRGKSKKTYRKNVTVNDDIFYDVLMCYVIRNGVRTLERINPREDKFREGEHYADCATRFGTTLSEHGSLGYLKRGFQEAYYNDYKVNIKKITDYDAGSIVELHWNQSDTPILFNGSRIHFFYDINGVTQTLRAVVTSAPSEPTGDPDFPVKNFAYFESDVPELLQDVMSQSISSIEKKRRTTRWLPAFKSWTFESVYILANGQEGYPLTVFADGEVLSSPLNSNTSIITATINEMDQTATVEFPDYVCYGYVGDSYECEFETLDLETGGERTITDAKKLINAVGLGLMETRGGFAGIPEQTLENMTPIVTREDESFNNSTKNFSGHIVVHIPTEWNEPGRATIKHVDPTPISILSVYPKGLAGD
jgi:hypothetical protein